MANRRDLELMNLVENFTAGELDRRSFVKRMAGLGGGAILGGPLAALALKREAEAAPSGSRRAASSRFQDPPPVKGGTLIAATIDKPVNMDPAFAQLYSSMQVYQNVFNKLVYVDADYNVIPGLAESWSQVDATTYEFKLFQNVFFHNDEAFTSKDVAYSMERVLDPALGAPNAIFLQAVDHVETPDDYTARVVLKHPSGSFISDLCSVFEVVNKTAIETKDPKLEPVGTGPFKFAEWVQDDHITLERWDKYHIPDRPYLDKVIFQAVSDDTVRETGLETDEMQWVMQVPLQKVEELKGDEEIKVTPGKPFLPDSFFLNCTKAPFDNVKVRQAIAWCIDRQQIVDVAFFGQADIATEPIYSGNPYFSGVNVWEGGPDYDKAKALLEEAGVPGLKFVLDGQPQVPTQVKTAQVLQQQFQKAGIEMEIQNVDSATWFDRFATKIYDATISYWSATIDPAQFIVPLLTSTSPWDFTGYASADMDALLTTFAQEVDTEKRKEAYKAVIQKYQEDAPLIPLDNQLQQYWVRANVYGMTPLPSMEIRMEPVYIAK